MSVAFVVVLAFGIGVVGGLRSMTAPAVVAWAAHLGGIGLSGTTLGFMGSSWCVGISTLAALGEFVGDLMPWVPSRISAFPLAARIAVGAFTGTCLGVAGGMSLVAPALSGALGAGIGAFGGYYARKKLVQSLRVPDAVIAIAEDLVAVGLGLIIVSRF
ncbi:MAG TPA: DUF4126 family protein [Candidatus Sulfotelmatobacter sp.]